MWETALSSTIIKTPNAGISSERMVFLPSVELTGSSDAYLHLKTFYYGFTLTCQPTSCWMNVTAHFEALPFFSVTNHQRNCLFDASSLCFCLHWKCIETLQQIYSSGDMWAESSSLTASFQLFDHFVSRQIGPFISYVRCEAPSDSYTIENF